MKYLLKKDKVVQGKGYDRQLILYHRKCIRKTHQGQTGNNRHEQVIVKIIIVEACIATIMRVNVHNDGHGLLTIYINNCLCLHLLLLLYRFYGS